MEKEINVSELINEDTINKVELLVTDDVPFQGG